MHCDPALQSIFAKGELALGRAARLRRLARRADRAGKGTKTEPIWPDGPVRTLLGGVASPAALVGRNDKRVLDRLLLEADHLRKAQPT